MHDASLGNPLLPASGLLTGNGAKLRLQLLTRRRASVRRGGGLARVKQQAARGGEGGSLRCCPTLGRLQVTSALFLPSPASAFSCATRRSSDRHLLSPAGLSSNPTIPSLAPG